MKCDAMDAWLGHWLKIQKKKKRPLVLKDLSDSSSTKPSNREIVSKGKDKRSKAAYVDSDHSEQESLHEDDEADGGEDAEGSHVVEKDANTNPTDQNNPRATDTTGLPSSPLSACTTRSSQRTFLSSLSDDSNYNSLIFLLRAAKVCNILFLVA